MGKTDDQRGKRARVLTYSQLIKTREMPHSQFLMLLCAFPKARLYEAQREHLCVVLWHLPCPLENMLLGNL